MNRMFWDSEVKTVSRGELEEAYTRLRDTLEQAGAYSYTSSDAF